MKIVHWKIMQWSLILLTIPATSLAFEPIETVVSILPQKTFVKRIGGEKVSVSVLVPPGSNPAAYEPRPSQMRAMRRSRIYFAIGVPFEKAWLQKMTAINPAMDVVHTDKSIKKRRMKSGHAKKRGHHYGTGHVEVRGSDPHVWLSPPLVKIQATVIAAALTRLDPDGKKFYTQNLKTFHEELDELDSEIRRILKPLVHRAFLAFHPSWGYFADTYGLKQKAVEAEGKQPSATEMAALIRYARREHIRALFVQPQFSTKRAEAIAREIGAKVVIADPLSEDWMQNLREVAKKIATALR